MKGGKSVGERLVHMSKENVARSNVVPWIQSQNDDDHNNNNDDDDDDDKTFMEKLVKSRQTLWFIVLMFIS